MIHTLRSARPLATSVDAAVAVCRSVQNSRCNNALFPVVTTVEQLDSVNAPWRKNSDHSGDVSAFHEPVRLYELSASTIIPDIRAPFWDPSARDLIFIASIFCFTKRETEDVLTGLDWAGDVREEVVFVSSRCKSRMHQKHRYSQARPDSREIFSQPFHEDLIRPKN